ncbi:MAG TPA: glycosyltransferase family 4 protein [Candidatus Cloacimonadota bacterium]|nr:glycosyltransferase family 4 protein [Candidatus Cloacimonadota bacterium]
MVRICHLSTVHHRNDTRVMLKECASLANSGYEVHLVIADNQGDEVIHGVQVHGLQRHHTRFLRMLLDPLRILRSALFVNASIYHFHDGELMFVGLFLRLAGKKVIYDVHDDLAKQILGKHYIAPTLRAFLARLTMWTESFTCKRFSGIVTAVSFMNDRFSGYNPRVVTVHNYPLLSEMDYHDQSLRERGVICYVGGITRIRGILETIKALEHIEAKMLLCGRFEPPELENVARSMPGWEKIDFLGFLGREEVGKVMSRASIGLLNLHPYANHIDSVPIKMMEYLGAGLPIVASNFPHWQELLGPLDCAVFVDPTNPMEIANAMQTLINDPVRCREMGERGKQAVMSKFNWQNEYGKLLALYRELENK